MQDFRIAEASQLKKGDRIIIKSSTFSTLSSDLDLESIIFVVKEVKQTIRIREDHKTWQVKAIATEHKKNRMKVTKEERAIHTIPEYFYPQVGTSFFMRYCGECLEHFTDTILTMLLPQHEKKYRSGNWPHGNRTGR